MLTQEALNPFVECTIAISVELTTRGIMNAVGTPFSAVAACGVHLIYEDTP
jgi:hypothetical protein